MYMAITGASDRYSVSTSISPGPGSGTGSSRQAKSLSRGAPAGRAATTHCRFTRPLAATSRTGP